ATIEWPEWNAELKMETEGPFECFVIYTPKGEDYFCAEPVTNCIDAFNLAAEGRDDTGMLVLEPGKEIGGTVRLIPSVEE
ncbi:MAG: aldose 1-epimerase, partial [Thermoanaerobaculia bacterium]|nr:aldose 1-epimerase [Thermoanaerobaculia bacterium]